MDQLKGTLVDKIRKGAASKMESGGDYFDSAGRPVMLEDKVKLVSRTGEIHTGTVVDLMPATDAKGYKIKIKVDGMGTQTFFADDIRSRDNRLVSETALERATSKLRGTLVSKPASDLV